MKTNAWLSRCGILCAAVGMLAAGVSESRAQPASEAGAPASRSSTPNDLTQVELLKSYLQLRDQLHATQLTLVKDRAESEAATRLQSSLLSEKIDALKASLDADRERNRIEADRLAAERERQQTATERSNQTILWVAAAFGLVGLLAMTLLPLFQWRAIRRVTDSAGPHVPQLAGPVPTAFLPAEAGPALGSVVTLSNQRLTSVIDRLERRILELEDTSKATPLPPSPAVTAVVNGHFDPEAARRAAAAAAAAEEQARINDLLGKGRALVGSGKPREAVACFDEVLKTAPNHAEALVKKGSALERLTRDEEAIRCYDRAISIDRTLTLAYLYKGGVCNRMGRYDDAVECYEQAMQMEELR